MNKAILIAVLLFVSCSAFAETVNTALLNVCTAPSMSGSVIGTLQGGTEVTVYKRKNGWAKIHPTKSRWVKSNLLSENNTKDAIPKPLVIFIGFCALAWVVREIWKKEQGQQELLEKNQRRRAEAEQAEQAYRAAQAEQERQKQRQEENRRRRAEAEQAEHAYRAAQAEQERQRQRQEDNRRRRAEAEARQAEDLKAAREKEQPAQGRSEKLARQERHAEIARLRKRVSALHPDKGGPGGNDFKEAKELLDKVLRQCREGGYEQ